MTQIYISYSNTAYNNLCPNLYTNFLGITRPNERDLLAVQEKKERKVGDRERGMEPDRKGGREGDREYALGTSKW